ncbi:uncharacterized protein IL334_000801 [Kwoniella shivajii]|uniref:CUE domain-containing protein n=1 Tax=Kwoniella shivajii TaxID=564305 RepID=A0ABZ1CRR0_9TREE|nr:hypothetical protein IL334_000801 [Kwoniella shivajii]
MSNTTSPTSPGRTSPTTSILHTEAGEFQHAPPSGPPPTHPQPTTTTTTNTTTQTQPPFNATVREDISDPKVAELHQMFPTVEISVIELILETSGGSTDRAIEQLLGMTDPDFRSDELTGTREDAQVDLDAEFARSLQLADEETYQREQATFHSRVNAGNNPPPPGSGSGGLPYQPRVRKNRPQQPNQQDAFYDGQDGLQDRYGQREGGENPAGMLAFEEKVEKFAEVGKQTFNSLLSKAKAKYTEYQTQQQSQQRTNQSGYVPENLSPSGDRYTRPVPGIGGGRGGEQNRNLGANAWDDRSPSLRSESISSESTFDAPSQTQPIRQSSNRWQPSDAYDDPLPPARTMSGSRIEVTGGRKVSTSGTVGSPDKQTGKIDPAKLGILPKKRVDLLSSSPSNSNSPSTPLMRKTNDDAEEEDPNPSLPNAPHSLVSKIPPTPPAGDDRYRLEDSDDELEYTKNPFDER